MTKRTITLLALAFTFAGAGTASAATQPTTPAPMTPLSLRTMRVIITNTTGGPLGLLEDTTYSANTWRQTPGDIADGDVGDYTDTATNRSVGATLLYALPTSDGSYIMFNGENPLALPNQSECDVVRNGVIASGSPFTCSVKEDRKGYNDTNYYVTVTRKHSASAAGDRAPS